MPCSVLHWWFWLENWETSRPIVLVIVGWTFKHETNLLKTDFSKGRYEIGACTSSNMGLIRWQILLFVSRSWKSAGNRSTALTLHVCQISTCCRSMEKPALDQLPIFYRAHYDYPLKPAIPIFQGRQSFNCIILWYGQATIVVFLLQIMDIPHNPLILSLRSPSPCCTETLRSHYLSTLMISVPSPCFNMLCKTSLPLNGASSAQWICERPANLKGRASCIRRAEYNSSFQNPR